MKIIIVQQKGDTYGLAILIMKALEAIPRRPNTYLISCYEHAWEKAIGLGFTRIYAYPCDANEILDLVEIKH